MKISFNDAAPIASKFYLHPETSYDIEPSTPYFEKNKTYYLTYPEEHDQKLNIDPRVEYKLNNFAHRCDDFDFLDKSKTNILFAGCSSTFGHSISEKYVWTKKLYNSIVVKNKGPFHSIGIPGAGIERVVHNIIKYCNKFGNPDYIFIAHADFTREVLYKSETDEFINKIHINYNTNSLKSENDFDFYLMYKFQIFYRILEIYCSSHNIKLISSSWDSITIDRALRIFPNTFINKTLVLSEHAKNFNYDEVDKQDYDLLAIARDERHPGIIEQDLMYKIFLSEIPELTNCSD